MIFENVSGIIAISFHAYNSILMFFMTSIWYLVQTPKIETAILYVWVTTAALHGLFSLLNSNLFKAGDLLILLQI